MQAFKMWYVRNQGREPQSAIGRYYKQLGEQKLIEAGEGFFLRNIDNKRAIIDKFRAREEYKKLKEQEQAEIKQAEKEQAQAVKDFAQAGFQELKKLIKNNPLT